LEGVTHALRSSEYHDRNPLYYWVVEAVGLRKPFIQDFARLNFAYTLLSKRKLQWFVDNGKVAGWNDPRFPTIQGILRRGLTLDALREFVLATGASKAINNMEMDKLWAVNKKVIDPVVPRYTSVAKDARCTLVLKDGPTTPVAKSVPRHKKNPSLGQKVIQYFHKVYIEKEDAALIKEGEELTLMDWGNAIIDKITKHDDGSVTLDGHLHLEGNFKTTEKKLTWVPVIDDLVPVDMVEYDYLITKDKLDENDNFLDFVNPNSEFRTPGWGDPNLRNLNKGDKIQLERRGYFICDEPYLWGSKSLVLVKIPDGHSNHATSVIASKVPTHERKTAPAKGKQKKEEKKDDKKDGKQ
jgi:glutamyl-tRNA synthetase